MNDDLTPGQREPLFQLVRYQRKENSKTNEDILFVKAPTRNTVKVTSVSDKSFNIAIAHGVFDIWEKNSYIQPAKISHSTEHGTTYFFILCKKALDYEVFMHHPPFQRFFISTWDKLIDDIPSLIWGIIGGTVAAVLTVIISNGLGLSK